MAHAPEPVDGASVALPDPASIFRAAAAGLLGWIVPGLGHVFIGDRVRGIICMATIVLTFWTGIAIGGVRGTVDPHERSLWFIAQLCTGTSAGVAYAIRENISSGDEKVDRVSAPPSWVSSEIGVHYTGVAGLLNILVILDAMARAERKGSGKRLPKREPPGEFSP
jgi:hypothetical protein